MNGIQLLPGEKIIKTAGIHWKDYVVPFFGLGASSMITAIRIYFFGQPLILALDKLIPISINYKILSLFELMVCAIFFTWSVSETIKNLSTVYLVTDQRIIAKKGWLSIRVTEMMISRCETITVSHPIMGRLLNYGDILAVSAGASIFLDDLPDPYGFKEVILRHLRVRDTEKERNSENAIKQPAACE